MANEDKKNQGPSCACGKSDLYEEWLKLEETKNAGLSYMASSNEADQDKSDADTSGVSDQDKAKK
jgi:hypothetical protein